jgi:simple sugar transport system permease protein
VYLYKYYGVVISGAIAGLGGAFLSMVASSIYREGQTGGRGYIGLAAMIFGNWRPGGLAAGSILFGYTDALQLRRGAESIHALLLLIAGLLVLVGGWQLYRRAYLIGSLAVVRAVRAAPDHAGCAGGGRAAVAAAGGGRHPVQTGFLTGAQDRSGLESDA